MWLILKHNGSFWAFHGSLFSNWHSILHNGLKNYSGTKHMTAGAVYGPGIYLGTDSNTSFNYAGASPAWPKSAIATYGLAPLSLSLCALSFTKLGHSWTRLTATTAMALLERCA